ncbi:MAG: GNAT family N-acetyltransferase [bacterium]|nr:GNAT family N-acetyltransferase [bacterium]
MIKEVFYEEIKELYKNGNNPYRKFFVYKEEKIIGYIVVDIIYERMEIIDVFVNESFRNRKIGTNMLKYVIEKAKSLNLCNITLEVNVNNKYAIKLYENNGFKKVALRKSYYNGEDGLLMELML